MVVSVDKTASYMYKVDTKLVLVPISSSLLTSNVAQRPHVVSFRSHATWWWSLWATLCHKIQGCYKIGASSYLITTTYIKFNITAATATNRHMGCQSDLIQHDYGFCEQLGLIKYQDFTKVVLVSMPSLLLTSNITKWLHVVSIRSHKTWWWPQWVNL